MCSIEKLYKIFLLSAGITTDSRLEGKNKIFFALKGEKFNGNCFASQALANGCMLAIVDDPDYAKGDKYLLVPDTLNCLRQLARTHRKHKKIPLLAITGSNGKTTTKELISSVLSKKYKVLATQGNLNNHIGVPLTVLAIKDHEFAIIEMGANHPGEIEKLCEVAMPDFGIITNIGKAHLEGFGTIDKLIKTKSELYSHLEKNKGWIIVNYSNPELRKAAGKTSLNRVIYGDHPDSVCYGTITGNNLLISASVSWKHEQRRGNTTIHSKLTGSYNLENILAAFTTGLFFNVEENDIIAAISNYFPSNNRSQLLKTSAGNTLILDAYNANPTSMQNALANLIQLNRDNKMAILGDMLELGDYALPEHQDIIKMLKNHKDIRVMLVGKTFTEADNNNEFTTFPDTESLIGYLGSNPVKDSLILIKGSRAIRLEGTVPLL